MEHAESPGISRAGWRALALGLVLATATELLPFLQVGVGYFVVLVHELGHALAGWLFGVPSLPAFDFRYGGGVTTHREQDALLVGLVLLAWVGLAWALRRSRGALVATAALASVYLLLLASGSHEIVMTAMGHGAELVFAALFLHRAISGRACSSPLERPLYAWIGFHIVLHDLRFAHGLATSAFAREVYGGAKGGGHWMDFSRLSSEFGVSLEAVAVAFFVLCLLPPAFALAINWKRRELHELAMRALS